MSIFKWKNDIARNIFYQKYALTQSDTWPERCRAIVEDVCGTMSGRRTRTMSRSDCEYLEEVMRDMKFLPGGRYIYYAGRKAHYWNNCFCLRVEEDTREAWALLAKEATACLMTGGGIGVDYSRVRPKGRSIQRTGGVASGSLSLMSMVNEIGRNVMQGGSRRSAIYASLNWQHGDIPDLLGAKDWDNIQIGSSGLSVGDLKRADYNYNAPLDMTNISLNYDDEFLKCRDLPDTYIQNVRYALRNGEPGFSFNFKEQQNQTLRNACCELTSEDNNDVCNLGAINLGNVDSIEELKDIISIASKFLVCGSMRADLPYEEIAKVRNKNRRIGLGLMGVHEWLLKRGYKYEMNDELRSWLKVYKTESEKSANEHSDRFYLNRPKGYRAIAPTGTIGLLAATTTGIEPLFSVAYKRRYLTNGTDWKYEYVVDSTAKHLIDQYGIDPDSIETATSLSKDYERRISFQADVQDYIDHAISSTINLPNWGSEDNNEDTVIPFARVLRKYCERLRGFTCYPDGSRGGQPITSVPYKEASEFKGQVFSESHDICELSGKGGSCGV